jgi:hypothetical protein
MPNHSNVGFADTEEAGDVGAGLLVVEGQDDDRALTLFQILDAASELLAVELRCGWLRRYLRVRPIPVEKVLPSLGAAADIEHSHSAHPEHKGCKLVRFSKTTGSQSFQRRDQNLLHEVLRRVFVSQVTQTIKPDAWSHSPEQLRLSFTIVSGADLPRQPRVVRCRAHQHIFYV